MKLINSLAISLLTIFSATGQIQPFVEDFTNNQHQWPFLGVGENYSISIEEGHLVMNAYGSAIHTFKSFDLHEDDEVVYHANMIFLKGDHTGWMGIRFNMNAEADRYCTFTYNNDKGFLISERVGKKYEVIRQSVSQVVKPYDYNSLTVIKKGSTYKFLINDKQVHEAKIKSFHGPLFGVMANQNLLMKTDEVQLYDPKQGRQEIVQASNSMFDSGLGNSRKSYSTDFQNFLDQFPRVAFPYYFSPQNAQGVDVSSIPLVQESFYQYVTASVRNNQMWAMCQLSECGDGIALLMMNRYQINSQDISRFFVAVFDSNGKLIQEREIGSMVKEHGDFFKVIDFKVYKDAKVMNIEATETFHNGNKNKSSVRYNTALCN